MDALLTWLTAHGVVIAFAAVLIEQLGLPLPAYPVLVVAGALSVAGHHSALALHAATVVACLLADLAWYAAGRRYGGPVLRTICRVSLSPDSCVRQTQSLFERWGIWSLLVAKFVPGFATLATALSGSMRLRLPAFVAVDAIGSALYVGIGVWLGVYFHEAVNDVVAVFDGLGRMGLALIVLALALFLAAKWWQRDRLLRELRGARITVPELQRLIDAGGRPTFVDVRPAAHRARDGTIPGALHLSLERAHEEAPDLPRDVEVVVYCACPNEVSAAQVARQLRRAGFVNVRPLLGGIDAWIAAGMPIERSGSV
ncbi:MAG TPA: DedA family protein/thiosulfate sulfurtransferase GlpE [Burkholderiaceae bacterium]|nr:DedA family protein/thiosulfate sulfurtransferase GlpE [Burkholderiaceae bacterium]